MKIAAYYARVSTNRQEKEATIESQIDEIEQRAKKDGHIIGANLKFVDDGWSGELERPSLDSMLEAAKQKQFELLYVYDFGRLSRVFLNQMIIINELNERGVQIIALHDINAENDEQLFAQRVMGLFHDYERKKIAERMRRGKLFKAKSGFIVHGPAPYGYDYVLKTKDKEGYWSINEEEAEVVRKIFRWIAEEKLTVRGVIYRLHELSIAPRKSRKATWSTSTLSRLLRNKAYIGRAYYNKSYAIVPENPKNNEHYKRVKKSSRRQRAKEEWVGPIRVPAILDEDLFYRVQEQLKLNQKFNTRNRKLKYLLPQKVFCICGRPRNIEGIRQHRYYRCTDRIYRFPLPRQCTASGVNAFHLDDMVWKEVLGLFTNGDLIRRQAERWTSKQTENIGHSQDEVTNAEKLLKKLSEEEERYEKAYGAGVLSLDQLKERVNEVRQRKQSIKNQIAKLKEVKSKPVIDMAQIDNLPRKFSEMLKSLSFEEKQLFLRDVLEKVVVGDGSKVVAQGCIPLEGEVQNNEFWSNSRDCRITKCGEVYFV